MTISNTNVKAQAAGNLVATAFPFTFKTYAKADVQVTLTTTAGVNSVLVLDSTYTVALNADQNASPGGTVTYPLYLSTGLPLPVGAQLTLLSNLADLQGTNLPNGGAFFGPTVTDMADSRTILSQQKQEAIDRSIKYPVNDPSLGATIPAAAVRAGLNLAFDSVGNLTVQATTGAVVSPAMIPVVAAASLVSARTLLGAGTPGIEQNSQSVGYTTVLADANKHILHPSADTTARTYTIPANSSVAYAIGTAITFVNQNAGGVITIAITTDTMRLAGAGTSGSRTLAANGIATALKVTATEWIISGTGLT